MIHCLSHILIQIHYNFDMTFKNVYLVYIWFSLGYMTETKCLLFLDCSSDYNFNISFWAGVPGARSSLADTCFRHIFHIK